MTLLVQAQDKEELEEYLISPQSSDYNEDGRLKSNKEDQIHIWRFYKMGNRIS